ncbi:cellulose synthase subunit BcsC-related outer membrane protein [Vibrio quintilis]|uniref:Cellulose synthase operon protein C n=1 Tax=Vibrio quintilis TaxID=1117707 RepID=A0A1M7Z3R6_9VIBR|nr:cellulose synthase subunit BcsC-related outer membrane protein [Vibrio quintilis]SHO59316.1 Cellulose synthase operon protein C precursor [Vibrio quintilis]
MKFIAWLPLGVLVFISGTNRAENVSVRYETQHVDVRHLREQDRVDDIPDTKPDTTALWYYIRENKKAWARQESEQLKLHHPRWQPEPALKEALAELFRKKTRQELAFTRVSQTDEETWPTLSSDLVRLASEYAFSTGKIKYHSLMGWIFIQRKAYASAIKHFSVIEQKKISAPEKTDDEIQDQDNAGEGIRIAVAGLVSTAIQDDEPQRLYALAKQYPQQPVSEFTDNRAWEYYEQEQYARALKWFEFSHNYFAQVVTLKQLEREQEAGELACAHLSIEQLPGFCADSYAQKQAELFDQKQYQASLQAAAKISAIQPLNDDQSGLVAWAHYHLGHRDQSVRAFIRLIAQEPDNVDYAEILTKLLGSDSPELQQLAAQYPLIEDEIKATQLESAWLRKQFDRFDRLQYQPETHQNLTLESGLSWRKTKSDDAIASTRSQSYYTGFSANWYQYLAGVRIDYRKTESETPDTGEWYGLQPLNQPFTAQHQVRKTGFSAYLKHQGQHWNLLAGLSYHKPADNFQSQLSGKLSVVRFSPEMTVAATLYREPVTDSLLSESGMFNQASQRWGAVHANGVKGQISVPLHPAWSAGSELDLAWLEGERVKANRKLNLTLSLTHDLTGHEQTLDYLRVSPFLNWLSYDNNQNTYTTGNGGYFSPENFISAGSRLSVLTTENRRWQVKAGLSLSYRASQPGNLRRLPYSTPSFRVPQSSDRGLNISGELEGQLRLTPHWTLAGLFKIAHGEDYREASAGIQLRWNFSAKSGVTSDILISSSPYQADYAWY